MRYGGLLYAVGSSKLFMRASLQLGLVYEELSGQENHPGVL